MEPTYYIPIFFMFFILWITRRREEQEAKIHILKRKKQRNKGDNTMIELAKKMIGKECLIYTFNGTQLTGTVAEVEGSALMLDNGKEREIVNLDYVMRIREYPKKKNGKKKSVVLD